MVDRSRTVRHLGGHTTGTKPSHRWTEVAPCTTEVGTRRARSQVAGVTEVTPLAPQAGKKGEPKLHPGPKAKNERKEMS